MNDNNMVIAIIILCMLLFILICYELLRYLNDVDEKKHRQEEERRKLKRELESCKKELELYKGRCEFISGTAIDYDGARTIKSLKETIDDIKNIANGEADDSIKDMIDQMSEGNNNDES